jgi:inosose dehydratase
MSPDRVLAEMAAVGMTATELGPDGFLPGEPGALRPVLARHGLGLVGGFVPVVLHDAATWPGQRAGAETRIATLAEAGATMVVLAASTGSDGYEATAALSEDQWAHLVAAVDEVEGVAHRHGMSVSLHPHYGTVIERPDHIERLLDTSTVALCLDTGHVMVGGGDPVAIAAAAAERVSHVHLKDVDTDLAQQVRSGAVTYHEAVHSGMYRQLGDGDVDVADILSSLDAAGYDGWFVLEQDTVLEEDPAEGEGPLVVAAASLRYLQEGFPTASADRE